MNFIAVIILLTIIIDFLLHFAADFLNLSSVSDTLPDEFAGVYDSASYARSQEYLRVNTRFGWVAGGFSIAVTLLFWFLKGFPLLDRLVRSWGLSPLLTGLLFMGSLMLAKAIFSLPFSIYTTFVIEERFGFNRTTPATFFMDRVKGLILALLIGTPLLAGILAFFEYAGPSAWWMCWLAMTLFTLVIQFIAPTWIMPLFNRFTPLAEGELRDAILAYARSIDFPLQNVFVMDGSKRSGKSNAFFTGFGKNRRIALFDTLIEGSAVKELVAVLAHEMGHYKKKHIWMGLLLGILQTGLMFYLLSLFISYQGLFDAFYMDKKSIYAGLVFFSMLYSPMDFFLGLLLQLLSRHNEFAADRFAVETTGDPASMAGALKKLSVKNLSNLTPHPFYVALNYSHPPVLARIRAIFAVVRPS